MLQYREPSFCTSSFHAYRQEFHLVGLHIEVHALGKQESPPLRGQKSIRKRYYHCLTTTLSFHW